MKFVKTLFAALLSFGFIGCFEMEEELTINEDGSGVISAKTDMGQMLQILASMPMDDSRKKKKDRDKKIDTTVEFKPILDTVKGMTAAEKKLFENSSIHINMHMQESVLNMQASFPFTSLENFMKMRKGMEKFKSKTRNMPNPLGEDGSAMGEMTSGNKNPMDMMDGLMTYTARKGFLSRTYDPAKKKEMMQGLKAESMAKEGMEMLEQMKYNTVLHLPRPVKKISNKLAELSADRKTVTIRATFADMMKKPQALLFTIEY
jgi:hypothetical protein